MGHTRNKAELKKSFKEKKKLKAKARKKELQLKRAKLVVKNLPFQVTEENLKQHFETVGKVLDVQLLKKEDGKLIGCGFVQFEKVQKAAKAKYHLNGKPFLGRNIECDFALPQKQYVQKVKKDKRQQQLKENEIKEEPIDIDEIKEEIKEEEPDKITNDEVKEENSDAEKYKNDSKTEDPDVETEKEEKVEDISNDSDSDLKEIQDSKSIKSDEDEKSENSEEEEEEENETSDDLDEESDNDDDSGVVDVDEPPKKKHKIESHDTIEGKTVFIKNLPFEATNKDLKDCMLQFGPVYYALVCMDKLTEHSKGTAFVKFVNKEDADKCLQAGTELKIFDTILDCHRALERSEINKKSKDKEAQKQRDSRNLYLIKEGVIMAGSKAAEGVSASDMAKRLQLEQYKSQILRNLNMFISKTRLAVHSLPPTWDDSKLKALCKKHAGPGAIIKEARVMRNMRVVDGKGIGTSKEFGFVTFTTHEHALNALRSLNNNPNVFSVAKRPIVGFSIENKKMVNARLKRMENSKKLNPLSKNFDAKIKEEQQKHQRNIKEKSTDVVEGGEFSGLAAKPGQIQKMRNRNKLQTQAQMHHKQLKAEKQKRKNATKSLPQRKEEFIRQDAQRVNKRKRNKEQMQDEQFTKMVNNYKASLINASNGNKSVKKQKWYE